MKPSADVSLAPQLPDSVLLSLPDTILRCTSEGVVTTHHQGVTSAGFADHDVLGRSLEALLPAPAAQVLLNAVKQTFEQERPQSAVYAASAVGDAPAGRRYLEVRTVPEGDGHVVCVIRDITEQRVAEQELVRRGLYLGALTQTYHRLLASAAQGDPVTIDTLAMLGYAAGASVAYRVDLSRTQLGSDQPVKGLLWRGDQPAAQPGTADLDAHVRQRPLVAWLPTLKSGRPVHTSLFDTPVDAADGATRPVMCLVLPIMAGGQLTGLLGLESSVRSQPWTDDEIDYLHAAIAAVALHAERAQVTAQLEASAEEIAQMNVQLADARDQAQASDRAKSEFLAVIGHEIRTPLNPVIAMTEMLLGTRLTSEQRDYAELAHEAAIMLLSQINAILDYVEVETGNLKLERLPFDPVEIVEKVADKFKMHAQEQRLSLMTFCHRDLPSQLLGDSARLSAVLENLLENALKFTEEGEIIVRVEPVPSETGAGAGSVQLRFSVSDTGIGLPANAEDWLFRPFTQADATMTRSYGGTGLGLATAKRWVAAMGGQIGARANPVGGTVFWYTVPCDIAADTALRWGPDEFWRPQTLEGLRVLVVDDLAGNRDILRSYLELWHASCDAVADGRQALAALQRAPRPYHIVLIDLMLPGMDGVALAGAIQQQANLWDTRLVLITAYDAPGQERRIRRLGFSGYLTKPFHREQLYNALVYAMATADTPEYPTDVLSADGTGLPAARAGKPADTVTAPAAARDLPTVLLIEHNTILRRVVTQDMRGSGCNIVPVATETEALRVLLHTDVDLVLFDLPGDNAKLVESARALRAAGRSDATGGRRRSALVGMAVQLGPTTAHQCTEAGLDECIAKPLTATIVRQLVSRWCANRD